jgi:hypothetical protein
LCEERHYDPALFDGPVARYPYADHNACPFALIVEFCADVYAWQSAHPQNLAAIHCKAGKGRTGLFIACYLLYTNRFPTAPGSLQYYAEMRTKNKKGVTIPSQVRYVHYFDRYLHHLRVTEGANCSVPALPCHVAQYERAEILKRQQAAASVDYAPLCSDQEHDLVLTHVRMHGFTAPRASMFFTLENLQRSDYKYEYTSKGDLQPVKIKGANVAATTMEWDLSKSKSKAEVALRTDVRIIIKLTKMLKAKKICQFWFHTRFVAPNDGKTDTCSMMLTKPELDTAVKDTKHKAYSADFRIELVFKRKGSKSSTPKSESKQ